MNIFVKHFINRTHQYKIDRACKKKLKLIHNNIPVLKKNKVLEQEYTELWSKFEKNPSILFQRCMSSLSGVESSQYVPENIHYGFIEPVLNNRAYALIFNDKNFYERYLLSYKDLFPQAILRGINGTIYSPEFKPLTEKNCLDLLSKMQTEQEYVLKPATETGGGDNVLFFRRTSKGIRIKIKNYELKEFYKILETRYNGNFIIQEKIRQLPWFAYFNKTSLNTVRLYMYRSVNDENVYPITAYLRFGKEGSIVDSSSQGGRTCGISIQGLLNDFALGKYGEKYYDLGGLNENKKCMVPLFNDMKNTAIELSTYFPYHRLLGFDFIVDINKQLKLFEVNNLYIGIINQQMNTGPLFGDFTDEVIEYSLANKKSVFIHHYI